MEEGYVGISGIPNIKSNLGIDYASKGNKGPTKQVGIQIQEQGCGKEELHGKTGTKEIFPKIRC